ncbi:MAG TPA: phosphatidate cytidylyltransferase [Ktedonobacteraceae bacterium]|nr:phosphatidate cytidylyltransferase [Ktedonobacteraceae bacterium]
MNRLQGAGEDLQAGVPEDQGAGKRSHSVAQRWLTALVAIPIVLLFVWFGGWPAFAATLLVLILCTIELHNMLLHAGYHPFIWVSLALGALFLVAAMIPAYSLALLEWGFGATLVISFLCLLARKQLEGALVDWALTLAIPLYVGWSTSCFLLLRGYTPGTLAFGPHFVLTVPAGGWWLLFVMLGVWGCDSAAFFVGRYFGRHKMSPRISPGKTWEGFAGGMFLAVIAALVLTVVPLGVPWYIAICFGLLLGVAAVLGDLAESLIKRQTNVKDSGQLMPGHGGMLDRVDSLLFAVMIVYACSQVLPFIR